MHKGKLVCEGCPRDVITSDLIKQIFGLNCTVIEDPVSKSPFVIPIGRYHNHLKKVEVTRNSHV